MVAFGPLEALFMFLVAVVPTVGVAALFRRSLDRAGFDRRLAAIALVPYLGALLLLCLLALADWPGRLA